MEVEGVLSNDVVERRQASLQEFSNVINAASNNLDGILKEIGWSIEDIQSKEGLVTCPINPQHRMVESSLQCHIERCKWVQDGYTREEQEDTASLQANNFFYENKRDVHAIELDVDCQREIMSRFGDTFNKAFPRTMDRLETEFSPEQRLAIYEKVIEKSQSQSQADKLELELAFDPDNKDDEDKKDKPKSHAEVLAEMRDYRRRRQSYRAKNVHITKKSRTDVMRDIIDAHMKFLEDTISPSKEEEEEEDKSRMHERTHSRSREGSSTSSRHRDRHRRSRSRDRRRRSRSRDQSSRRDDRSRSSSRSRDSHRHKHRHHHSKHKHKSRHRSPLPDNEEID